MYQPAIQRADRVQIQAQGYTVRGVVISAINYGTRDKPDWYIELTVDEVGYAYWKQSVDGGSVRKL